MSYFNILVGWKDTDSTYERRVSGTVVRKFFGVHKSHRSERWVVSHLPTGLSIVRQIPSRERAIKMARRFANHAKTADVDLNSNDNADLKRQNGWKRFAELTQKMRDDTAPREQETPDDH